MSNVKELLKEKLTAEHYSRLMAVDNVKIHGFVADAIELTNPDAVFVCTDSEEDVKHVREMTVKNREESPIEIEGHTVHFPSRDVNQNDDSGYNICKSHLNSMKMIAYLL